jgi:hypothetical protein
MESWKGMKSLLFAMKTTRLLDKKFFNVQRTDNGMLQYQNAKVRHYGKLSGSSHLQASSSPFLNHNFSNGRSI